MYGHIFGPKKASEKPQGQAKFTPLEVRLYLEAILVSWDTTREDNFDKTVKELINLALAD